MLYMKPPPECTIIHSTQSSSAEGSLIDGRNLCCTIVRMCISSSFLLTPIKNWNNARMVFSPILKGLKWPDSDLVTADAVLTESMTLAKPLIRSSQLSQPLSRRLCVSSSEPPNLEFLALVLCSRDDESFPRSHDNAYMSSNNNLSQERLLH